MIALAALIVLAIVLVAALPWIASTQLVRDRIAYELSLWSGYRVSLGAAPEIEVWPGFRARLSDVAFHEWGAQDAPPVLEADRLEASLSALAALRGEVVLSGVSLHRPLLRLTNHDNVVDLPASPHGGRMMAAMEAARAMVRDGSSAPDASALPAEPFGTVDFSDGRIDFIEGDDGVTSLNGRITWPALNRGARLAATGIWRGENVSVEVTTPSPLLIAAGASTPLTATLKSSLVEASFDGTADLGEEAYFEGQANLSSPSLRRMLEWMRVQIAPGAAIGEVAIASRIQGNAGRLRLDNATVTLGSNTGRGVLEVSLLSQPLPSVAGTLAFDGLDLLSFLSAFMPVPTADGTIYTAIDTSFVEQLSLDLRLSAASATLGGLAMADVAASAQVRGSLAAFDISDATVFGGTVQAGVKIEAAEEAKTVELRMTGEDVDAFMMAKAVGADRLLPQGRATLSATLKGVGRDWNTVMGNAEGTVSATLGPGALVGLDLARFRERWATGGFFALSEVIGGSLELRGLDFRAKVVDGVARIEKAEALIGEQQVLSIGGIIPYFSRALALSGYVMTRTPEGEPGEVDLPFFIGGAWDVPFVSPAVPAVEMDYE